MFGMKTRKEKKDKIADQLRQKEIRESIVWISSAYSSFGKIPHSVDTVVKAYERQLEDEKYATGSAWRNEIQGIPYKFENERLRQRIEELEDLQDEKLFELTKCMILQGETMEEGQGFLKALYDEWKARQK